MSHSWKDECLEDRKHEHSEEQLLLWTRTLWKHPHLDPSAMAIRMETLERDRKIMAYELLKLRKQFVSDRVIMRNVMMIKERLVNVMCNAFSGEIHDDKRPNHY